MQPRIYSKVSQEMWGDQKFRALTPLAPSGQALWFYLLTGRFRTIVPGINLNVGIGALTDRLGWAPTEVEGHWREIETLGMAHADWQAGVVFLPKAIEHNTPESPNVIRGWAKVVLPECPLIAIALGTLRGYIAATLSKGFLEAFDEAFPKGLPPAFPEGFPGGLPAGFRQPSPNQEQEQEQDQPPLTPPAGGAFTVSSRKPTKAETQWAETLRRGMGCRHDPKCDTSAQCVGRMVMQRRIEVQAGMHGAVAAFNEGPHGNH